MRTIVWVTFFRRVRLIIALGALSLWCGCVMVIPVFKSSPVTKDTSALTLGKGKNGVRAGMESSFDPKGGISADTTDSPWKVNVNPVSDISQYMSFLTSADYIRGISDSTDFEVGVMYTPIVASGGRIGIKQRLTPPNGPIVVAVSPRLSYMAAQESVYTSFPGIFTSTSQETNQVE